jgi:oligoendopeptidase F
MTEAQARAYAGTLDPEKGFHLEFWASKLHFFETEMPFYNFPYTFGFLFSNAVYQRARSEGSAFAEKYKKLLMDTGRMETEDLVKKHMDEDITDISFWNKITDNIIAEIPEYIKLAKDNI